MAIAQQSQEDITNRSRKQSPTYQVGDKVWLNLTNIKTYRPSKKLDAEYAKFTVIEVIGSHAYRLDTPPGIHNVFHTSLLKLASIDPFPSQVQTDSQPLAEVIENDEEYRVEEILQERLGKGQRKEVLVKWLGYYRPIWEPRLALQDTATL